MYTGTGKAGQENTNCDGFTFYTYKTYLIIYRINDTHSLQEHHVGQIDQYYQG